MFAREFRLIESRRHSIFLINSIQVLNFADLTASAIQRKRYPQYKSWELEVLNIVTKPNIMNVIYDDNRLSHQEAITDLLADLNPLRAHP